MQDQFTFTLKINDGTPQSVNAVYTDAIEISGSKESEFIFIRETISFEFKFVAADFDLISSQSVEDQFLITMTDGQGIFSEWQGRFTHLDCEFDNDHKILTVTPLTVDEYDDVLANLDREFNLLDLDVPTQTVSIKEQLLVQIYNTYTNTIGTFIGGNYFEQPCEVVTDIEELTGNNNTNGKLDNNNFNFHLALDVLIVEGTSEYAGLYVVEQTTGTGFGIRYLREDGMYQISRVGTSFILNSANGGPFLFARVLNQDNPNFKAGLYDAIGTQSVDRLHVTALNLFCRALTNLDEVASVNTLRLSDTDFAKFGSYTKCAPFSFPRFSASQETSEEATRYGRVRPPSIENVGRYFVRPTIPGATLFPISRSTWGGASVWVYYDAQGQQVVESSARQITLNSCFEVGDVINGILKEVSPTVRHLKDLSHSNILYNPTNLLMPTIRYFITPKSNVTAGDYDQPATQAPIRLSWLSTLFADFFKTKWFIDSNKFILEHDNYFRGGKSYDAPNIGLDTTTELEPRTRLPYSYYTSSFTFDKPEIPSQILYKWMDESSEIFEGSIRMVSNYAKDGEVETKSAGRFTSDIDFIFANAENISPQGFVLMLAIEDENGNLSVPLVDIDGFEVQNGYASMRYLIDRLHRYNAPSAKMVINSENVDALSVARTKSQDILFPYAEFDNMELIKTLLGNGNIDEYTVNLLSRTVRATIKHDI